MNSHKNARLTFEGRKLLIERIAVMGLMPAAEAAGISVRTARKWRRRFEAGGLDALMDSSSRPAKTRSTRSTVPTLNFMVSFLRVVGALSRAPG